MAATFARANPRNRIAEHCRTPNGLAVFTLAPEGQVCIGSTSRNCFNIIADRDLKHLASDLTRRPFGELSAISNDLIFFRLDRLEGQGCDSLRYSEFTGYLPQQERLVVRKVELDQQCECCESGRSGHDECPCETYKRERSESFKTIDGESFEPSPRLREIFRRAGAEDS